METALQVLRKKPTTMAALGRFGPFKPESERVIRTVEVELNPVMEGMKKVWKKAYAWGSVDLNYVEIAVRIQRLEYRAKDVEGFSLALAEFQHEDGFSIRAGIFLSGLINNSDEDDFVIHTAHLAQPVDFLGILNTKRISVEGSVGSGLGYKMRSGTITLRGDARGEICDLMSGGEVHIDGDYGGIDTRFSWSGKIFHKGKLIVDK